jgi:hypothetical protein
MEASEKIQGRFAEGNAPQGVLHPIGEDRIKPKLASRDDRHAGMARLLLMVNTILPRLSAAEDRPSGT